MQVACERLLGALMEEDDMGALSALRLLCACAQGEGYDCVRIAVDGRAPYARVFLTGPRAPKVVFEVGTVAESNLFRRVAECAASIAEKTLAAQRLQREIEQLQLRSSALRAEAHQKMEARHRAELASAILLRDVDPALLRRHALERNHFFQLV